MNLAQILSLLEGFLLGAGLIAAIGPQTCGKACSTVGTQMEQLPISL